MSEKELDRGDESIVEFPGDGRIMVHAPPNGPNDSQKPKVFSYNVVFEPAATQEDVLQFSGKNCLPLIVQQFQERFTRNEEINFNGRRGFPMHLLLLWPNR